jgi:hypothetical protein
VPVGQGIAAAAAVLGAFSWRKLQKLVRPGNREVVLSAGALEQGMTVGNCMTRGGAEAGHERTMATWRWERWVGNGGGEAVGAGKVAVAAVRRRSVWSGRRPGREAVIRAHVVLYFPQIIQIGSKLKNENGCLTMLQKFTIYACG